MIEIIGPTDGPEYEAATHLRRAILRLWPDLEDHPDDRVKMFVSLKLYGYEVQDIDLFVVGWFSRRREFRPRAIFRPREGEPRQPRYAGVRTFALVIETKRHDPRHIRFEGNTTYVSYHRAGEVTWECVSEQSLKQRHALRDYLRDENLAEIFIQNLIYFPNLREADLPPRPHNMFGRDATFEKVLDILGEIAHPYLDGGRATIAFGSGDKFGALLSRSLFRPLEPTPIDRRRMDRIAKGALEPEWLAELGEKQVIFKGRGGAGKTVILLQLAYRVFDEHRARSLVLTYNKALIADMRRTLALLGVPRSVEKGGIHIDSVMSFIGRVLVRLGVMKKPDRFLETYDASKAELVEYLKAGVTTSEELRDLLRRDPDDFGFDHVFVDEGQDWPADEITILRALYPAERLVVSDGVDQFVRESVADWETGVDRARLRVRRLRRCLRMKANLAAFANAFAKELDLYSWNISPNDDAMGGRGIVVDGDYFADWRFHERLCRDAAEAGNQPVDLLACVPPSLVRVRDGLRQSIPGEIIVARGGEVWDGAALDVRDDFPRRCEQFRIVQYDSCRGLEGWMVIALGLDDFYEYKYQAWFAAEQAPDDLFKPAEEAAREAAGRWVMIPLTRAMDTLVLQIGPGDSAIRRALMALRSNLEDIIEWHTPEAARRQSSGGQPAPLFRYRG